VIARVYNPQTSHWRPNSVSSVNFTLLAIFK